MSSSSTDLLPRLCLLEKGADGYGFHLHGEKGKSGQFIRLVEEGSPAQHSGLRAGDRLVEVNGENVENESHQQVVGRIRDGQPPGRVRLLVVDRETDQLLNRLGLKCVEEYIRGIPGAGGQSDQPQPKENETERRESSSSASSYTPVSMETLSKVNGEHQESGHEQAENSDGEKDKKMAPKEHRPRLCQMKKGAGGYGFNLHSDKSKPGQYIRAVDPDSPAEKAGLFPQDRIIEVNGICMEGKQHSDVVTAIKSGGDETKLLVVDPETDEFFKKYGVIPTQDHINGPLPEVIANGEVEEKVNKVSAKESESVSLTKSVPDAALSVKSTPEPSVAISENSKEENSESSSKEDLALDFNISLAAAKERAHQKRSCKRAPQMDWSKKNELFSNL